LLALVLLVAYFGVWRGYETVTQNFGREWGMIAAALSLGGLAVIAITGWVVARTIRAIEPGAGTEAKKAENQRD
jgi:hypothetical protein